VGLVLGIFEGLEFELTAELSSARRTYLCRVLERSYALPSNNNPPCDLGCDDGPFECFDECPGPGSQLAG
jgi:hypothetical protein